MRPLSALLAVASVLLFAAPASADSTVVGRSGRHPFGRWEWMVLPRLQTAFGTSTHFFTLDQVSSTTSRGTTSQSVSLPSDLLAGHTVVAQTVDLRPLTVYLAGPLYIAGLFQIGPAFRSGTPNEAGYSASKSGTFFEGGLVPGLGFRLGGAPMSVRLEALVGGRIATFGGKLNDASQRSFTGSSSAWVVSPRVALDFWTSPHVTVGAFAGMNALRANDYVFGLSIAAHLSPFDATE